MSMKHIRFDSKATSFTHQTARLSAMALLIMGAAFPATAAMAASNSSDANTRYQAERALCNNGQSNQDRATCLREAGAALAESKGGRLSDGQHAYRENARIRCNALPADDRDACQRRINGEGSTSGSVGAGGVMRELVTPDNK